jgi:ketosteroid isomerase-like protein
MMLDVRYGGLDSLQSVAALPHWPEGASEQLRSELAHEETAIRDQFMVYGYAFDNQDLDAVMSYFTDDCVITNPRGKVSGAAAIRANYKLLFDYWSSSRHLWVNVIVRFPAAVDAYIGAYHYAMLISGDQTLAGGGTDLRRLTKVGGEWKIAERWITDDVDHEISLYRGPVEDPQKVKKLERNVVD